MAGDPAVNTGGNVYNRKISDALVNLDVPVGWLVIDDVPASEEIVQNSVQRLLSGIPAGSVVLIDSLIFGSLGPVLPVFKDELMIIHMDHMPFYLHSGISPEEAGIRLKREKLALSFTHLVITTSEYTTRLIRRDLDPKIPVVTVEPGIEPLASKQNYPLLPERLITVANILPSKAYEILVEALFHIKDLNWSLQIIGDEEMDSLYTARIKGMIREKGLADRIHFPGSVSDQELWDYYVGSDLFVLPTRHETFGMVIAEAIAAGLPVITTRAGGTPFAFREGCGIMLPANDATLLKQALERCLTDAGLYEGFIKAVSKEKQNYLGWDEAGARILRYMQKYYPY